VTMTKPSTTEKVVALIFVAGIGAVLFGISVYVERLKHTPLTDDKRITDLEARVKELENE